MDTRVNGYWIYQDTNKDTPLNSNIITTPSHPPCHQPHSAVPPLGGSFQP